jgi:hypothetical protein
MNAGAATKTANAATSKLSNLGKKAGDTAKAAATMIGNNYSVLLWLIVIGLAIWSLVTIVQKNGSCFYKIRSTEYTLFNDRFVTCYFAVECLQSR